MSRFTVVNVTLRDGEDGVEVFSDDLPGLILSGRDRTKTADSITPAIEALFQHKGFAKVIVRLAVPLGKVLQSPSLLQNQDIQVHHEQFVIEFLDAGGI